MSRVVNFSEAVSIGIHSMVLIARSKETLNVLKISEMTGASKHHVAKILQRLVKDNFLSSTRGPNGGFTLKKAADQINLLEIYESIDGVITVDSCPMDNAICPFEMCLVGNVVNGATREIRNHLSQQVLSNYAYKMGEHHPVTN